METPDHISLQFLSEPTDINYGGKVHGGEVMKWIDQAAFACASQWCRGYCVTVYVGGIRFYRPIHIGHLIKVNARLIYTGTTSMHISVDVYSKPVEEGSFLKNTHCIVVFAAVDKEGKTKEVDKWHPKTQEEENLQEYALRLMKLRKNIEDEMRPFLNLSE